MRYAISNAIARARLFSSHLIRANPRSNLGQKPPAMSTKTTTSSASVSSWRPIRVLMLHGYTQSGPLFHAKTRALEKSLQKAFPSPHPSVYAYGIQLVYPTAPFRITPPTPSTSSENGPDAGVQAENEPDSFGWWKRKDRREPYVYEGLEETFTLLAKEIREKGPFDGVMGFSQGGCLSGFVASALEAGRKDAFDAFKQKMNGDAIEYPEAFRDLDHPPLKFAVSYSGFAPGDNYLFGGFYEPKISTPMMHFLGSVDTLVEEKRSMALVDRTMEGKGENDKRVVWHPGGHFLPTAKQYVDILAGFIKETCEAEADGGGRTKKAEESVEDMDVPF